jgi:hypothetical protein
MPSSVGQAYAEGRLQVADVARSLNVRRSDAAALLESRGYFRAKKTIELQPDEREAIFDRIRADRIARCGRPSPSDDLIHRDMIASQRLEGVDARAWIPSARG